MPRSFFHRVSADIDCPGACLCAPPHPAGHQGREPLRCAVHLASTGQSEGRSCLPLNCAIDNRWNGGDGRRNIGVMVEIISLPKRMRFTTIRRYHAASGIGGVVAGRRCFRRVGLQPDVEASGRAEDDRRPVRRPQELGRPLATGGRPTCLPRPSHPERPLSRRALRGGRRK